MKSPPLSDNPPGGENPLRKAAQYGIDLSLLQESLRRTPTERLTYFLNFLSAAEELRRAGARKHPMPLSLQGNRS